MPIVADRMMSSVAREERVEPALRKEKALQAVFVGAYGQFLDRYAMRMDPSEQTVQDATCGSSSVHHLVDDLERSFQCLSANR